MSFPAIVFKVMLASPSDVSDERAVLREAVYEWNAINSEDRSIVLMPVGWETHASPSMAAPAQEIINEQVLSDCDLLIGVFWTRLGTPTANHPSGSVEEVQRHLEAGKPAMLYFADRPVELSSVDRAQYDALIAFKTDCQSRGLIEQYSSLEEFRHKITRHLAQVVQREFVAGVDSGIQTDVTGTVQEPTLSREARILLYNAAQAPHAQILKMRHFGGTYVQANRKVWPKEQNARLQARWSAALDELVSLGLASAMGYKGEVFSLTDKGFQFADEFGLDEEE